MSLNLEEYTTEEYIERKINNALSSIEGKDEEYEVFFTHVAEFLILFMQNKVII